MGQGQAEIALKLLDECARQGEWLCLKNLHLVTAWLPSLEKVCLSQLHLILSQYCDFLLYIVRILYIVAVFYLILFFIISQDSSTSVLRNLFQITAHL